MAEGDQNPGGQNDTAEQTRPGAFVPPNEIDEKAYARDVRRLLAWGAVIIGALLVVSAILMGVFGGALEFESVDSDQLGFLAAGTAVAAILSLISLYAIIVKGHLAPFVCVMALIAFGLSAYLIMSPDIGNMGHARGVITVIFTVGTVSLALILVMGVIFAKWPDPKDARTRFNSGKEVLTMLLGILGTVVGFYFGSADDTAPSEPLSVTRVAIDPEVPEVGKELVVSFSIDGGKPPFTYALEILDATGRIGDEIQVVTSERHIQQSVSLVDAKADKNLGIRVKVTDDDLHDTEHHQPAGSWVKTAAAAEPEEPVDPQKLPDVPAES